jgi:nucleoside-diphosphate-sugar epimerase
VAVPLLVSAGHDVTATTRRPERTPALGELGATGVVADVFDADAIATAVASAEPDVILDLLTALADRDFAANERIRREGTTHLVDAALAAGTPRMIVESIAWAVASGDTPATEDEPALAGSAVDALERQARRMPRATVLRFGMLYGPGTWSPGDRASAMPAITNLVHVDDAAAAILLSLDWPDGTYNIVDDHPAPDARPISNARARSLGWTPR